MRARTIGLITTLIVSITAAAESPPGIARLAQGVPHVQADNYFDLGYRAAWANAEDDLCSMAADLLIVRGELARNFGPGEGRGNVASDQFYTLLRELHIVSRGLANSQPSGRAVQLMSGFVAGYNEFVRTRPGSDPRCAGESWIKPMTIEDAWSLVQDQQLWFSFFAGYDVYGKRPPAAASANAERTASRALASGPSLADAARALAQRMKQRPTHSNGVAFGRQGTANGGGVLMYDPHIDTGFDNVYTSLVRLTVPGEIDVIGHRARSLPGVVSGSNADLAWGVTAAIGRPYAYYELRLAADDPTVYIVDGVRKPMERIEVIVPVRTAGGSISMARRTYYRTQWGLVLDIPGLEWTSQRAYALFEFNFDQPGVRFVDYHLAAARARNVSELRNAVRQFGGWIDGQTIAADGNGNTQYIAKPGVVYLPPAKIEACVTPLGRELLPYSPEAILDGSRGSCRLASRDDSYARGAVGFDDMPQLQHPRYVASANDSHWLVNPHVRLTGFGPLYDQYPVGENRLIFARTKMAFRFAEERITGSDGQPGRGATVVSVSRAHLSSPLDYTAAVEAGRVIARCRQAGSIRLRDGETIDLREACDVLEDWDRKHALGSRGGGLWRLFFQNFPQYASDDPLQGDFAVGDARYLTPFDVDAPITTPRDLDVSSRALQALGEAVRTFRDAGVPLDARLRDVQRIRRASRTFGQPGCPTSGPQHGCLAIGGEVANLADDAVLISDQQIFGTAAPLYSELKDGTARVRYIVLFQTQNPASPYYYRGLEALNSNQFAEITLTRP